MLIYLFIFIEYKRVYLQPLVCYPMYTVVDITGGGKGNAMPRSSRQPQAIRALIPKTGYTKEPLDDIYKIYGKKTTQVPSNRPPGTSNDYTN